MAAGKTEPFLKTLPAGRIDSYNESSREPLRYALPVLAKPQRSSHPGEPSTHQWKLIASRESKAKRHFW